MFRSLENLMTFPFVRSRVESGEMQLHGAYFGVAMVVVETGAAVELDPGLVDPAQAREKKQRAPGKREQDRLAKIGLRHRESAYTRAQRSQRCSKFCRENSAATRVDSAPPSRYV